MNISIPAYIAGAFVDNEVLSGRVNRVNFSSRRNLTPLNTLTLSSQSVRSTRYCSRVIASAPLL